VLNALVRSTKTEVRMRDRALMVLLAADGVATREIGTASRLGVRRRSPSTETARSRVGISVHSWNRTCHYKWRTEPAAEDQPRVATIASAAIYSFAGLLGSWPFVR
jgi:hypothetical protein